MSSLNPFQTMIFFFRHSDIVVQLQREKNVSDTVTLLFNCRENPTSAPVAELVPEMIAVAWGVGIGYIFDCRPVLQPDRFYQTIRRRFGSRYIIA